MDAWRRCVGFLMCLTLGIFGASDAFAKQVKWDNNADWASGTVNKTTYLKVAGQLQLVFDPNSVKETPYIYIPNSGRNTVVQMDTRTGAINWTYNLAVHNLGSSPSRTTVDLNGNVWVGLRNGSHVVGISPKGKFLASVNVGSGPRAITIDHDGHIWAGGVNAASITQISGTTFKVLRVVRNANLCGYGATTDSAGNIWVLNRCRGNITKIIAKTGVVAGHYSAYECYGIAADKKNSVWVASWVGAAAYQYRITDGKLLKSYPLSARGRGVAVDATGNVWVASSHTKNGTATRQVNRINPTTGVISVFRNVGLHTIGIAIDSKGFLWANSYNEGKAYKLNATNGQYITTYDICDTSGLRPCANTGCTRCTNTNQSQPYTYSDMTGFQLQTSPAQGTWNVVHDAKCKAKFSSMSWNGANPANTSVRVRARSAATRAGLAAATWGPYVAKGAALGVADNRFVEIQFFLETQDSRITPTITDATLTFNHFPEVCDGVDNNCDGSVDEAFSDLGASCTVGVGVCERTGKKACKPDKSGTHCPIKPGPPGVETCNDKDDDCDGNVDEDFPDKGKACTVGVGACKNAGTLICRPGGKVACSAVPNPPQAEICDGKDNNCDGNTDENLAQSCTTACGTGAKRCVSGKWTECSAPKPSKEVCDGKDNDCDGNVDNDLTRECSTSCGKGREKCVNGSWVFCDAPKPKQEICDGKDNDCNGKTDDGIKDQSCQGACGKGTATCKGGKWTGCSGPQPKPEECNGKDDDCDGKIDLLTKECRSNCGQGRQLCKNGVWSECSAPQPQPEVCDGADNNCDGKIDENAKCPAGTLCKEGRCQLKCRGGECPGGSACVNDLCVGDLCAKVKCSNGLRCVAGRCINPCDLIECPKTHACEQGKCVKDDCYRKGCPGKQTCVEGRCVSDPCANVNCSSGQFCREGQCVDSCANVNCKENQLCRDGKCVDNPDKTGPCASIKCDTDEYCRDGKCHGDPCARVKCSNGKRCVLGVCDHDPCLNIKCPSGQKCSDGQCFKGDDPVEPPPSPGEGPTPDGGSSTPEKRSKPDGAAQSPDSLDPADKSAGNKNQVEDPGSKRYTPGCGCSSTPTTPSWLFLGLFVLLALLRQRRA